MSDRHIIASSNDPRINPQPIKLLVDNVNSIGLSVNALFMVQATTKSVGNCDDLLHALSAAKTAVRKLRVKLAEGES